MASPPIDLKICPLRPNAVVNRADLAISATDPCIVFTGSLNPVTESIGVSAALTGGVLDIGVVLPGGKGWDHYWDGTGDPGISRVDDDTAGGVIQGGGQSFVRVQGYRWAVLGDAVTPHGPPPHNSPVMVQGSPFVRINGIPVCRAGHLASCGDAATGSASMRISS